MKRLLPSLAAHPECVQRFSAEIALHRGLVHHNIVRCLDAGDCEGVPYLVLEYVDGVTLRESIEQSRPARIPLDRALHIASQLCEALEYLHGWRRAYGKVGWVHCDVCPENLLIGRDGEVKLIDFGLAMASPGDAPAPPVSGISWISVETERHLERLQYVAPEQIEGTGCDRRCDVYSVGATLFELVHGVPPFAGCTVLELGQRIFAGATSPPDESVDPGVAALIARAMAVRPSDRTATARELGAAIGAARGRIAAAEARSSPVSGPRQDTETLKPREGSELARQLQRLLRQTRETAPGASDSLLSRSLVPGADPGLSAEERREARASAALQFDRGWAALRKGRTSEALVAWEAALALDPENRVYAVNLRRLRQKLEH